MLVLPGCPLTAGEDGAVDAAVQGDAQVHLDASAPRDVAAAMDAAVPILERAPRLTQGCAISANQFVDPGFFGRFQLSTTSLGPILAGNGGVYDAYWAKAFAVGASGELASRSVNGTPE